jgi:putative phosphoribosyl transferase
MMRFKNRAEAGRFLAERLSAYANRLDTLVLGLPRGGVPVAYEVASILNAPLDVFVVRKLGVPGQEELAMGAIATGGARTLNHDVIRYLRIPDEVIDEVTAREEQELERRERLYRDDRPARSPRERVTILVDDGLATGSSMRAAALAVRRLQPASIVVAVPVAASQTCEPFYAVGLWYEDFSQTTDEEVREMLARAENKLAGAARK